MEVTDAMRQAVYADDCLRYGHRPRIENLIRTPDYEAKDGRGFPRQAVTGPDAETLPHVYCERCGAVWICVPAPGSSYDDAERILYGKLRADDDLARTITRHRSRRQERDRRPGRDRDPAELTPQRRPAAQESGQQAAP